MQRMQASSTSGQRAELYPERYPNQIPGEGFGNNFDRLEDLKTPAVGISPHLAPDQSAGSPASEEVLEATKRYLERQRTTETTLLAMDDEESDGRPAWLRSWPVRSRREIANRQYAVGSQSKLPSAKEQENGCKQNANILFEAGKTEATPDVGIESRPRLPESYVTADITPASVSQPTYESYSGPESSDDAPQSYTNGYTGQSIEASFSFDTVYHFETEFEAEATEDWLNLSTAGTDAGKAGDSKPVAEVVSEIVGGASSVDVVLPHTPYALLSSEQKLGPQQTLRIQQESNGETQNEQSRREGRAVTSDVPSGDSSRRERMSQLGPNGDSLAAAREDLTPMITHTGEAREASIQRGPVQAANLPFTALDPQAVRAAIFRLAHESPLGKNADARTTKVDERSEFAEVALGVWSSPVEGPMAVAELENSDAKKDVADAVSLDSATVIGGEVGLDAAEAATTALLVANSAHMPESVRIGAIEDFEYMRVQHSESSIGAMRADQPATEWSSSLAESGPLSGEGYTSMDSCAEPRQIQTTEDDRAARMPGDQKADLSTSRRNGSVLQELPTSSLEGGIQQKREAAADAPALAHDAGNLLSALNLYSELLALSGVLHARHKHYAQDLKLLAARSEVLISRLLTSCSAAENATRKQVRENHGLDVTRNATQNNELGSVPHTVQGIRAQTNTSVGEAGPQSTRNAVSTTDTCIAENLFVEQSAMAEEPEITGETLNASQFLELATEIAKSESAKPESPETKTQDDQLEAPPLNLVDLLTRWRSLLSMIGRGSVEVNFGPNSALPIRVKEDSMERILVNLVHNAMTATRNGGAIRIGVGRVDKRRSVVTTPSSDGRAEPGNRLVLTVDDSGCGMSEEQIERIFRKRPASEERIFDDPSAGSGRGMGLQIVRDLLAASGGQLTIYSRRGAGTRIEMEWPVVEDGMALGRTPPVSIGSDGRMLRSDLGYNRLSRQMRSAANFPVEASTSVNGHLANEIKGAVAC